MRYVFDSSAIFGAIKENKIELLVKGYTLELARYEMGNILWKNYTLQAKVTERELRSLAKLIKQVLNIMEIIQVNCSEEEILDIATKMKITFYDASYVHYAKTKELTLITEDGELLKRITPHIKALKLNEITNQAS
jgi:predicted nucleic acid-binding protein